MNPNRFTMFPLWYFLQKNVSLCTSTKPSDELKVTVILHVCLCLGPSTDSMIRVGGDYQAQIPEFKPGTLRGGRGGGVEARGDE